MCGRSGHHVRRRASGSRPHRSQCFHRIDDGGERHLRILIQIACRRFVAFQINADRRTCSSRSGQAQDGAGAAAKLNAQTLVLRYTQLEPEERRQPTVAEDYKRWYLSRLKLVNARLDDHEFLCTDRFTIADIAVAYALFLGESLGIHELYKPQTRDYLERMKAREGFEKAQEAQRVE